MSDENEVETGAVEPQEAPTETTPVEPQEDEVAAPETAEETQ